jgi:hypothetical protein
LPDRKTVSVLEPEAPVVLRFRRAKEYQVTVEVLEPSQGGQPEPLVVHLGQ